MNASIAKSFLAVGLILMGVVTPHALAGTSGPRSFGNDDALDWVENALKPKREKAIAGTISALANRLEKPEVMQCCATIAACEVLAALRGRPAKDLPEEVAALARQLSMKTLVPFSAPARVALEKILRDSELRELWAESSEFVLWKRSVEDLKLRLTDDTRDKS